MAEQIIGLITYCLFWVTFLFSPFIESKTGKEIIMLLQTFLGGAILMFGVMRMV